MGMARWALLTLGALVLQTQFFVFGTPLNVSVALVYAFAIRNVSYREGARFGPSGEAKCTAFGGAIGFLEDLLSGTLIGPEVFSKGMTGLFTAVIFSDVVFRWPPLLGGIAVMILTILDGGLAVGLRLLFTDTSVNAAHAMQTILIQALFNIPFGVLVRPANLD